MGIKRAIIGIRTWAAGLALAVISAGAAADEAVSIGGPLALLNKPNSPRAALVLIPGGDGTLDVRPDGSFSRLRGNQLVRTRKAYLRHGIATLTIDRGVDPAAAVRYLRGITRKVAVAGTSRGSLRVPDALSAKPDGIVLTAAFLADVQSSIGTAGALPRTLIVHHRNDQCRFTLPAGVEPFKAWGGARVQVAWMQGGTSIGNPCLGRAYHGFNGIDDSVVSTIARFVTALR
jgi:hypothetical protein